MRPARTSAAAIAALAVAMLAAGCAESCPRTFVSVHQLTGDYNANAAGLGRLWARAKLAVTVDTGKGFNYTWGSTDPRAAYRNGLLMFQQGPQPLQANDFVLIGRETAAVELFRIGSSLADGVYYMWYRFGEHSGAAYGRNELAGAPCAGELAIEPQQLLSLLGVIPLPSDPSGLPAVALEMDSGRIHCGFREEPCAYVLTYVDRQPLTGQALFKRKVYFTWSDDHPPRPFRADFIAPDGRRVLTADLGDYQPVADSNVGGRAAVVPTNIRIAAVDWPGRTSRLRRIHIVLSEMTAGRALDYSGAAEFWRHLPMPPQTAVQIDRDCWPEGTRQ